MQYNRNTTMSTGTLRKFFFASSKSEMPVPMLAGISQSDKFVSVYLGVNTVILFETKNPVSWNEARDMVSTQGAIVTMCKGPVPELDGSMYSMMRDGLLNSDKWVHTPGVAKHIARTFFKYTTPTAVTVVDSPTVKEPVVVNTNVSVVKREKSEKRPREVFVISDSEEETHNVNLSLLPTPHQHVPSTQLPETQPADEVHEWM